MKKRHFGKRMLAMIMSAAVVLSTVLPSAGTVLSVSAASTYAGENLLVNPDFEESTAFSPAGGSHAGNWFVWQDVVKTTDDVQSGDTAVKFTGSDSALEQDVTGLQTGMTYVYTVWAKLSGTNDSAKHTVGVKNYGGDEIKRQVTSTEWEKIEIEFVYTSGTPRVYGYTATHGGVDMYMDNASVVAKGDIQSASIENGKLDVTFADTYTGDISADVLEATYFTSADSENVQTLTLSESSVEGTKLSMTFQKVKALAVEQTVTVELVYGSQRITLDYVVEASGEDVVTAKMVSVDALQEDGGLVTIVLDAVPTVKPVEDDFTWEYKVGEGEYKALEVTDFAYDEEAKTVTAAYSNIRGSLTEEATVTVKVTYNGEAKEASYKVAQAESNVYYVDSTNGSDDNDGLTPETAIGSIDKLNTLTFAPGDEILFKKGETFVGCFKPMGSGTEGAPIKIGVYGEGDERPVLQPGEEWTVSHVMSANAIVNNAKVNYVLQFYNVEYWEVSGLEIYDPDSEAYLTKGSGKYIGNSANDVYRSGITIQAEDIGTLEHFYIDDVIIHGFHGPGTNIGKTSGGITMNVITNAQRNRSLSVPTQINDIRITNCEIYDVGRTGINFLTPWSFRTEEKWGPFNYGTRGYDYLPYEDFYLGNNYIHDVDGDGTIVDNCSNAVVEYNLVTRCCIRPATEGGGAAVGLFNWNSDDTYFQFNEVYDIWDGSGATASNDSQGIEIDALNDRTWVQYNYVHDNTGGFMMLCNVGDNYRSFDGIIRYNISQNDYTHPRQGLFDIYSANYGTQCYNNTFYFTDRVLNSAGEIFLFSSVGAYETMKFYNNIFYYDGETPAAANKFGDGAIDWQSNIFYGFTNLPVNDNPGAPNIAADPMLVNIGAGGTGKYPGDMVDLSCYYTIEGSPAIDAGVPVEDNGGRDYFGNPLTAIPDIGAYESESIALKVVSSEYAVDQEAMTVTISGKEKVSVAALMEKLFAEEGVELIVKRSDVALAEGVIVKEGDAVEAVYDGETITYTVTIDYSGTNIIPVDEMSATAGDWEKGSSTEGDGSLAIDENTGTMWHTDWYVGPNHDNHWIQVELDTPYLVDGFTYLPRQSGTNGIITAYEIYVSNDGKTWDKVAEGEWAGDSTEKVVTFDPVEAKFVKLQTIEAMGDQSIVFASAAEIRVTGSKNIVCEEHVTEIVDKVDATETGAGYTGDEVCTICGAVVKEGELVLPKVWENPFTDISETKWYYNAVAWGSQNNVVAGIEDDMFYPTANSTRAQIVSFLWRAEGRPEPTSAECKFTDIDSSKWYYKAVLWATEKSYVAGYTDTKFAPNATCKRAEMATFLWRMAGKPVPEGSENPFFDVPAGKWYETSAKWAYESGIVSGYDLAEGKAFAPDNTIARAETVTMLYRFYR